MLKTSPASLMGVTRGSISLKTHKPEVQRGMVGGSASLVGYASSLGEDTAGSTDHIKWDIPDYLCL